MRLVVELNSCPSRLGAKRSFSIISFFILCSPSKKMPNGSGKRCISRSFASFFASWSCHHSEEADWWRNIWKIKMPLKRRREFRVENVSSLEVHSTHAQQPCLPFPRVNDSNHPTDAFILLSFVNAWSKSGEWRVESKGASFDCKLKIWPLCQDC